MSKQSLSPAQQGANSVRTHLVLGIIGFIMVFPFIWQLVISLSTNDQVMSVPPTFWPGDLQWGNFVDVFTKLPFFDQFGVSVGITVIRVIGQVVLCSMAGYAFARMRFRGRGIFLGVILSILMVPPQVYLIPQFQIIQNLGLLNTIIGIALPGIFSAFGVFLMRQIFLGLPIELEEAARLDGANPVQIFYKIMLPLATPGISALVIITTLWSWNDLLWPLVVTTYAEKMPLSAGLATLAGSITTDYPVMMAASVLAMAPVLILFIVLQRRVVEGLAFSGSK
ncbi:multiple sugar transport system permease protein [Cryobacterium flavum]|uniref:Carbohydrate ABC transporter permease n=1 Tax=Cryobacterium flavum TaxID=1424659 RepID=A0A4R8VCJ7_9MICO|nr:MULTISPECIES: carbohydrate ABC transporter permease [Cryobacterium]TFB81071.1 carbohydrate ABC transporter permease [Cryobacterium flavum]TFD06508.1 carbohydrate ABC transporter permease [Cryobacterium sp. TMT1-66-1]TFD11084.1 carbohydrate ABC transporter permease [Cryobacterium sp. TMT1-2-2]SDM77481.1 multiple sugar transport system permease protein [Cryobacterium flavum]